MKIMMLTDFYSPGIGGTERYVQSLASELVKRGHQVIICTVAIPGQPGYEEKDGLKIYRIPALYQKIPFLYRAERVHPPMPDPVLSHNLKRIIEKEKPDLVHAHSWIVYSVIPLLKKTCIPLVLSLHTYGFICSTRGMLDGTTICDMELSLRCVGCSRHLYSSDFFSTTKYWVMYLAIKANRSRLRVSVDKFIAVSSYVKSVHQKRLNLNDEKITLIPVFIPFNKDEEIETRSGLPDDFILFVGRLVPEKGIDTFIAAYRISGSKTKLVLIGTGHLDDKYKDLENVLLIENAPSGVLAEAYRKCRFAVFPSTWPEPCATVTFEAMSHRKAVIATELGGFPDIIINGETGMLVPPQDADALLQAMKYLLENPKIADIMGENGYKRYRKYFTTDVVVPEIEKLYESVVKEKRRV